MTVPKRGYRFVAEVDESTGGGEETTNTPNASTEDTGKRSRGIAVFALGALGLALLLLWIVARPTPSAPADGPEPRYQLTLPRGVTLPRTNDARAALAISPDGRYVAFVGAEEGGPPSLYVRNVSELDARRLPDTEGAGCPFFSPDGRWLGFEAVGKLKKIELEGGAIVTLADAPRMRGASWGDNGQIVFSSDRVLLEVAENGGDVRVVSRPTAPGVRGHRWPHLLPGDSGRCSCSKMTPWTSTSA